MPGRFRDPQFERYIAEQSAQLIGVYKRANRRLTNILKSVRLSDFQRARAEVLLQQVRAVKTALDTSALGFVSGPVRRSYARGTEYAVEMLGKAGINHRVNLLGEIHRAGIEAITRQMTIDLLGANTGMTREVIDVLRQTQQAVVAEIDINRDLVRGAIEGEARRETSARLTRTIERQLDGAVKIPIIDKNGATRLYDPEAYAKLVTRTRTREAMVQGQLSTAKEAGVDLVQISVHENPCEVCEEFQGKVYSISGTSERFPALDEEPPYHPNCGHTLVPVTEEFLQEIGELDALSALSNSESVVTGESDYQTALAGESLE